MKARWRRVGNTRMQAPKMGVTGRFQQLLCSSVVLGPPMPLIMHAGDQDGGSSIISCASSVQRIFFCSASFLLNPFIPKDLRRGSIRYWGQILDETGSFDSLFLPRRRLRSDGPWSLGQEQQTPSAASWMTEQPYSGSTLLTSRRGRA